MGHAADTTAVEMIEGLVRLPQPEASLLLEAGYLLLELGRHKEAEEVFAGVSALLPHSEIPMVALGNVAFAQGHFARALKFHQEAAQLKPQSALAQAHIGEALLWLKKPTDAVAALNKALALEPGSQPAQFAQALLEAHAAGAIGDAGKSAK